MASTPANVTNLASDQLAKWLIEDAPYKIQIARIWPFMAVQGGKISYARTPVLESVANINSMATILGDGDTITAKTADPAASNSTFQIGELATRYKTDYTAMDRFKVPNSIDAVESALAIRRLIYMYFRKLDLADAGTKSGDFKSLGDMCAAGNKFNSANGTAVAKLDELQKAYNLVTANNGRPNAIMCNSRAYRWIVSAWYNAGLKPEYIDTEWADPIRGTLRGPQLAINGTPLYINDMIATDGTSKTKVYFMVLGDACDAGPTRGVTGIVPAPLKGTMFVRRETAEPSGSSTSQVTVDYTFPVATAMGSSGALAMLENVDVTSFA